jgi:hypothetical protein
MSRKQTKPNDDRRTPEERARFLWWEREFFHERERANHQVLKVLVEECRRLLDEYDADTGSEDLKDRGSQLLTELEELIRHASHCRII